MKKKIAIAGIIAALVAAISYLFVSKWDVHTEWKKDETA